MMRVVAHLVVFAQLLCQVPAQYSADETIKTAIAAASIVRIQGQYDLSKSCQWPDCAPVCEDAPATPMGSCKVPGKDKCVWDSSCIVGTCFCDKGTRPENGACVAITCSYGAMPPKFEAPSWVKGFAGMGPTPPPANADANAWKSFAFACAKMPFLLCVLGIAMAATTCICIQGHLECECSFLPTSPVVLLALCAVTVTIIATGVTQRVAVVNESMALAETQLSRMETSILEAVQLGEKMDKSMLHFEAVIGGLPDSCSKIVPGSKTIMSKVSTMASLKIAKMKTKVDTFNRIAGLAAKYIHIANDKFDVIKACVRWIPVVPLFLMFLGIMTIAVSVIVSWCSSNPEVAEIADCLVLRFGSVSTCGLMVLSMLMVSGYLYVGVLTGGFCLNVDNNIIDAFEAVNFTQLSHYKYDIDPILSGTAKYYIQGSQENPLSRMLDSVEHDAMSLYSAYNSSDWAVGPAKSVCSGIKDLNAGAAVHDVTESIVFAQNMLAARNMWPYFNVLVHELMCGTMLRSMQLLIIYTSVISAFFLPMISLFADIDLRKWAQYKEENFHEHYNGGSEHPPEVQMGFLHHQDYNGNPHH